MVKRLIAAPLGAVRDRDTPENLIVRGGIHLYVEPAVPEGVVRLALKASQVGVGHVERDRAQGPLLRLVIIHSELDRRLGWS